MGKHTCTSVKLGNVPCQEHSTMTVASGDLARTPGVKYPMLPSRPMRIAKCQNSARNLNMYMFLVLPKKMYSAFKYKVPNVISENNFDHIVLPR